MPRGWRVAAWSGGLRCWRVAVAPLLVGVRAGGRGREQLKATPRRRACVRGGDVLDLHRPTVTWHVDGAAWWVQNNREDCRRVGTARVGGVWPGQVNIS